MSKKQVIKINENKLKQIVMESVKRVLKEEVDIGQILSSYDNKVARQNRMNLENRPEITAARKELRRLRNSIEDVEQKGGDITPIRQKMINISNHYFDRNYIWHLQRGDKWVDFKGWFDIDGNPAPGNEELEWD